MTFFGSRLELATIVIVFFGCPDFFHIVRNLAQSHSFHDNESIIKSVTLIYFVVEIVQIEHWTKILSRERESVVQGALLAVRRRENILFLNVAYLHRSSP